MTASETTCSLAGDKSARSSLGLVVGCGKNRLENRLY